MIWLFAAIGLALAGLVPIVLLAVRVLVAAGELAGELERAGDRLARARRRLGAATGGRAGPNVPGGVNQPPVAAYDRA
ncbi:hypothetical protein Sru01_31150 [Sphaerisporangium rufum]|uniref:Uncharacterized protein n=1 Tax=Sphaerisporangium rufum TaxID=1381558 RepID=A0A919V1R5_9ACTN|nr:hypothetical protein [Sphaerisporangium rufum]GII78133.1 hypothetical protein Sru01_31150 [Sphaerisporangium rufum]